MLKLKLQYFGYLMWQADLLEKTLMVGKIEGKRKRGWQRMRWLDGITDSWVWASSGREWWTGKPGVPQSMRSQRGGRDWASEQQQNIILQVRKWEPREEMHRAFLPQKLIFRFTWVMRWLLKKWGPDPAGVSLTVGFSPLQLEFRVWDWMWGEPLGQDSLQLLLHHWVVWRLGSLFCHQCLFLSCPCAGWSVSRCLRDCQSWHLCLSAEHSVVSENRCGLVEQSVATIFFFFFFFRICFDSGGFYQLSKCQSVSLIGCLSSRW